MSELGRIVVDGQTVVWRMEPGDARDLADFIEEVTPNTKDVAHKDVAALREAADEIDGGER